MSIFPRCLKNLSLNTPSPALLPRNDIAIDTIFRCGGIPDTTGFGDQIHIERRQTGRGKNFPVRIAERME
jgi:hypothetical protein